MKNRFFVWTALTLVLVACDKNNDENPYNDGPVAAEFRASIYEVITTRASGTTWDAEDRIGITGIGTSYDNVPYILKNGTFEADGTVIYFHSTEEVVFRAYYPYSPTGALLTVTTDADAQEDQPAIDFLFATGATGSTTSPNVSFVDNTKTGGEDYSFHHCMSQLTLTFMEGSGVNFDLNKPTQYTLSGLKLEGTFDTATGIAAVGDQAQAEELTMTLDGALQSSVILFPQNVNSLPLNVLHNGQTYSTTLTVPDSELMAGKNYMYNVFIKNKGITIELAGISGWETVEGDDAHAEM